MDSETPIVKLIAGAVGLVVVCFCVGFFLLGGRAGGGTTNVAVAQPEASPSPLIVQSATSPKLSVIETGERKSTPAPGMRVATSRSAEEATPGPRATPNPKSAATPLPRDTDEGVAPATDTKASSGKQKNGGSVDTVQIPAPNDEGDETTSPAPPTEETPPSTDSLYRVRVKNAFSSHDDADQLASELKGRGFAATVMPSGKGKFQVQIGAYKDKKRAEEKQKELEKNNYETHVSDKSAEGDDEKADKSSEATKKSEGEKKSGDG